VHESQNENLSNTHSSKKEFANLGFSLIELTSSKKARIAL
jgi:hypothetical protein